jgi:hypothetical protein
MPYISDTHRIERALFPFLALNVLIAGAKDQREPGVVEAKQLFWQAHDEAFEGLGRKRQPSLMRRLERVRVEIMAEYERQEIPVCKFGLILYHVMRIVTDCDYLVVPTDSAMSRGLDLLLPALEEIADEPGVDASAQKQARRVLDHLGRIGLFRGALNAADLRRAG